RRTLAQPIPAANVGQRSSWVGMTSKILQINDVRTAFPRSRQRRHAKRVHGHGGIEPDPPHIDIKEGLDGAASERPWLESVPPFAASGFLRTKQREFTGLAADDSKPLLQSLNRFRV